MYVSLRVPRVTHVTKTHPTPEPRATRAHSHLTHTHTRTRTLAFASGASDLLLMVFSLSYLPAATRRYLKNKSCSVVLVWCTVTDSFVGTLKLFQK